MSTPHYTNPHTAAMTTHTRAVDAALHVVDTLAADLAWFDGVDRVSLDDAISVTSAQRAKLQQALAATTAARVALDATPTAPATTAVGAVAATVGLVLAPLGMAAGAALAAMAGCGVAVRAKAAREAEQRRLDALLGALRHHLSETDATLARHSATRLRHAAFDRAATQARLDAARADRDGAEAQLAQAVRDHEAAEARLVPLATLVAEAEAGEAEVRARIALAETFEQRLSAAANGTERRRIHGECACEFGKDSPADALKQLAGQLAGAERTTAKRRARLAFATHDTACVIDHVVLDGSNFCFGRKADRDTVPRLSVLDALIPALAARYHVTVIFDDSIRKRLRKSRAALQAHFGEGIEVHVTQPNPRGADYTFLRYADGPNSYVVTNDQLTDFPDVPVVRAGRLLQYELLERMVEIPVLDVVVHFGN